VGAFFLAANSSSPRECCFVVPLNPGSQPPITAHVCIKPSQNVTGTFQASPITKADAYQLPVCGYEDPLAAEGLAGVAGMLAWGVGMSDRLCLQVRAGLQGGLELAGGRCRV